MSYMLDVRTYGDTDRSLKGHQYLSISGMNE